MASENVGQYANTNWGVSQRTLPCLLAISFDFVVGSLSDLVRCPFRMVLAFTFPISFALSLSWPINYQPLHSFLHMHLLIGSFSQPEAYCSAYIISLFHVQFTAICSCHLGDLISQLYLTAKQHVIKSMRKDIL